MPSYIIKPVRERDFYVEYSTIVDCWTMCGSRADLIEFDIQSVRLDRADRAGTSALDGFYGYDCRGDDRLAFREVGTGGDWFRVPYADIEAMLSEQEREGIPHGSAEEQALYERYGKKWEVDDEDGAE